MFSFLPVIGLISRKLVLLEACMHAFAVFQFEFC